MRRGPKGVRGPGYRCLGAHPQQRDSRETEEPKVSQPRLWTCARNREEDRGPEGGSRCRG